MPRSSAIFFLGALCIASGNHDVMGFTSPRPPTSRSMPATSRMAVLPDPLLLEQIHQQAHLLLDPATTASLSANSLIEMHPELASAVHQTSLFLADAVAEAEPQKLGWWGSYLNIFKNTLSFVHSTLEGPLKSIGVDQSWGISIAVFTAGIRSLLVPLSIQQSKSAEYMKALKPYVSDIKQKFKDNPDAQNRATSKLYEDANQNPLAGCLVSLFQLPVFLGLYRGVRLLALDGELQEPFLWIPSLEGPVSPPDYRGLEWLTTGWTDAIGGGLPTPQLGWETTLAFCLMPLLLVLTQAVTMNALQPPLDDNLGEDERAQMEQTQTIIKFLPLMIGFFSLQVPAGLTIYWFTSNIFTLSQSLAVRAYFAANPPDIKLPEYWDNALKVDGNFDEMSPAERRQAAEAGMSVGPTFLDMKDTARFHCLVERGPFRLESEAWQRVSPSTPVPPEMAAWVGSSGEVLHAAATTDMEKMKNQTAVEAKA